MSYEVRINVSELNVNAMLKEMGVDERFTEEEKAALKQYRLNIFGEDQEFQLYCATLAAEKLMKHISQQGYGFRGNFMQVEVTGFGIEMPKLLGAIKQSHSIVDGRQEVDMEKIKAKIMLEYRNALVKHTKTFLQLLEEERAIQSARRAEIAAEIEAVREKINENVGLLKTLKAVLQKLIDDGYSLRNEQEVLEIKPLEALVRGVHIIAKDARGVVREVWLYLPGGKHKVDVHVPPEQQSIGVSCREESEKFAQEIAELLNKQAEAALCPDLAMPAKKTPHGKPKDKPKQRLVQPSMWAPPTAEKAKQKK